MYTEPVRRLAYGFISLVFISDLCSSLCVHAWLSYCELLSLQGTLGIGGGGVPAFSWQLWLEQVDEEQKSVTKLLALKLLLMIYFSCKNLLKFLKMLVGYFDKQCLHEICQNRRVLIYKDFKSHWSGSKTVDLCVSWEHLCRTSAFFQCDTIIVGLGNRTKQETDQLVLVW